MNGTERPDRSALPDPSDGSDALDRPLAGLTVIEWATNVAGPYCGKLLAGFGAEVIKIEPPEGDPARRHPPFASDRPDPERSVLFLYLNTGKRSLTLDVSQAAGRDLLDDLTRQAAILIEDHRPAELAALGLGYEHWAALNPSLVVASITPFGQTGPRADDHAYPLNSCHAGGEGYTLACSLPGVDRPPVKVGSRVGDFDAGVGGFIATLAAVYWRELTGQGQHVDVSAQDTALSLNRVIHGRYTYDGTVENRLLRQRRPGTLLRCRDGYVELVLVSDETWGRLCRLIGRPELATDERYATRFARDQRTAEINALLEAWAGTHGKLDVARWLQDEHIPGGPYLTVDEVAASPQYESRRFFQELEHPVAGAVPYPTVAYRFSETPWEVRTAAPQLGADTDAILASRLAKTPEEIVALRAAGVI